MEDVLVLNDMLQRFPGDRKRAFEEYSKHRNPDAEAMCDLAMYNYIEVRCLVIFLGLKRKKSLFLRFRWEIWQPGLVFCSERNWIIYSIGFFRKNGCRCTLQLRSPEWGITTVSPTKNGKMRYNEKWRPIPVIFIDTNFFVPVLG